MRKAFALLFITLSSATAIAQPRPTGLVFEDTRYQATPKLGHGMSFSSDPKPAHSLKKYCPTPGNQGSLSSCVGWASGYGAYTIAYCQKNGITDQAQKDAVAFNPMYVYLNILPATSDCNVGTNLNDAMDHLLKKGDCKLKSFSTHDCRPMPGPDQDNEASTFTIKDYGRLFSSFDNAETKILGTVKSISEGKPVVIGMKVTPSFYKVGKEAWVVTDKEENLGGHAMVVVGYDNMRKMFEIMNSWGTTWGNGGFFEMSYPEYAEMVRYGVQMNIGGGKVEKEIAGNFHFKKYVSYDQATGKYNFSDITPTLNDGVYSLNVNKDDYFRIVADNMTKDCYVYVFSLKPNKSVEILYPEDKAFKSEGAGFSMSKVAQIPRVLSDNASITIPDGEEGGMTSDQAGEDYLCVLYSSKTIDDIQEMVKKVNTSSSSDFHAKLKDAFGDRLVDKNTVYYEPQLMAVKSKVGDSYIVPIVLRANVQ